jgi:hypothetical protein
MSSQRRDETVVHTPESIIALATAMVLRSGADRRCEERFLGRRGPKRRITWLGFLVTVLLAVRHKVFRFDTMADIYVGLPRRVRARFDVPHAASRQRPTRRSDWQVVLDSIHQMWEDLCHELDSSPITRPYPNPSERRRVYETRIEICDLLASGWMPSLPHDAHVEDGTAIDGHRNRRLCGDPHGRKGHRTGTDRDPRDFVYGFDLCAVIPGATERTRPAPPFVVLNHETVAANEPEGFVTLRLYARHAASCDLRWAAGDRLISHTPLDFSVRVVALGGMPVQDLHEDELGQRGMVLGFLVIDCWLWHAGLTAEYWKLPYSPKSRLRGEYRSHFAAHLLSAPTVEHPDQVLVGCPGRQYGTEHPATVDCPGCIRDDEGDHLLLWRRDHMVDDAPRVDHCPDSDLCKAPDGVWLPLTDERGEPTRIGRAFQTQPRLSPAWFAVYAPLRAAVENAFSTITTPNGANLAERAHLITGLPGTALWVSLGLALHNHHRTSRWLRNDRVREELACEMLRSLDTDPIFAGRVALERHFDELFPTT